MKDKIIMLVIGILIGAIVASAGFLIFGGNNKKGRGDFDPSKFKDGDMTPPNFSKDKGDFNLNNIDLNKIPEKPAESE